MIAQAASRANQLEIFLPEGLLIAGLVSAPYESLLTQIAVQPWQDPDYSHGFVVPLFVDYVLYQRRHELRQVSLRPNNLGLLVVLGAIGLLLVGTLAGSKNKNIDSA